MNEHDAAALPLGLYRLYWCSGGSSLAAVGQLDSGRHWFAPTNWTNASETRIASTDWSKVERAEMINEQADLKRRVEALEECERRRRYAPSETRLFAEPLPPLPDRPASIQSVGTISLGGNGSAGSGAGGGGGSSDESGGVGYCGAAPDLVTNPRTGKIHNLNHFNPSIRERVRWSIVHGGDIRWVGNVCHTRDPDENERANCGDSTCRECAGRFKSQDAPAPVQLPRGGFF